MPKLFYISIARFPTEKAHGLQIVQNCEAFAHIGYDVELWVSNRRNTPEMKTIQDPYKHYGVDANFLIRRVPCIDLYPFAKNLSFEKIAFYLQVLSFCISLIFMLSKNRADIYYTRDEFVLLSLSLIIPREKLVFEAHQFRVSKQGAWLQRLITKRAHSIIAVSPKLKEDFIAKRQAEARQILVAHDGIRAARFENLKSQVDARKAIAWPEEAFIVGYMGRLHTMGMDKGVGSLVQALAQINGASIALVGGPDDIADKLCEDWLSHGADKERFLYAGTVPPDKIPIYLSAFDVCAMPFPWNPHYAYYMSPLKLFEYMASGRVVLATDLPSISEIVQHEYNAFIVPPDNISALEQAIQTLKENPALRAELGKKARETVMNHYTWTQRAQAIRNHIERDIIAGKE